MRIGMVCPYSFDVAGGVQSHVLQLAEVMRSHGHYVSVLAPFSPHVELPDYVVSGGKAVPIPYNGSVARLRFGPATHRKVKKWIVENDFDVLHLHEPNAPSLSMLALMIAEGPIVATFHTSTTRSFTLSMFQGLLRPWHEKIVGRIAVSDLARRWQMEALGSDAVEIPNGLDVGAIESAPLLPGYPRPGKSVLFLGRFDEPRKGMSVLLGALPTVVARFPDLEVLIVGRGDEDELRSEAGDLGERLHFLGQVNDVEKASALRSADVYCAPNTGGESFGIVLVEAMAARTAVVASDLDAFRRVLLDGKAGRLVPVDDSEALADALIEVIENDEVRNEFVECAAEAVQRYDWSVVARQIMRVYDTVAGAGGKVQVEGSAVRNSADKRAAGKREGSSSRAKASVAGKAKTTRASRATRATRAAKATEATETTEAAPAAEDAS
jgi:phosphatidylinositol alpha-mannosyltransferase